MGSELGFIISMVFVTISLFFLFWIYISTKRYEKRMDNFNKKVDLLIQKHYQTKERDDISPLDTSQNKKKFY